MKLPSISSPWTIVKWGSVLLIYGLTVGISLDQIRGRDATILGQKARVIKLESTIPQVTRNLNKIQAEISATGVTVNFQKSPIWISIYLSSLKGCMYPIK